MRSRGRRVGAATVIGLMTLVFGGTLPVAGESHDISIVDFAFEPAELTVFTGEPVSWTNNGEETHNVTSVRNSELASGDLAPTEGYGHVFETPGVYAATLAIFAAVVIARMIGNRRRRPSAR